MSTPVVGAVLMGGRSSRFGSDKALADADGKPMGRRVADAMRRAHLDPVVAAGGSAGGELGLITIPDRTPDAGPLAALASLLSWANVGGVVVVPCDVPLITAADIAAIVDAWRATPDLAACAMVEGTPSIQLACWPAAAARRVQRAVDGGQSRFQDGLDIVGWTGVEVSPRSISDADNPTQLGSLLRMYKSMPGSTEA